MLQRVNVVDRGVRSERVEMCDLLPAKPPHARAAPRGQDMSARQMEWLERMALAAAHAAPHRVPLFRAAADGLVALVMPRRDDALSKPEPNDARPTIVLIGDDDDTPTGPTGWRCAGRVRAWGRFGLVHAAGGKPEHYRDAVLVAGMHARLLLVETCSTYEAEWIKWLQPAMPGFLIGTKPGDAHPRARSGPLQ